MSRLISIQFLSRNATINTGLKRSLAVDKFDIVNSIAASSWAQKSTSSLVWLRLYVFSMGRGKWRVELVDSHHFKPARIKGRARAFTRSDSHPYRGGATNRSVVRNFPVRNIDPPPREGSLVGVHLSEDN